MLCPSPPPPYCAAFTYSVLIKFDVEAFLPPNDSRFSKVFICYISFTMLLKQSCPCKLIFFIVFCFMVAFENILVPPRGSPLKTWSIKQSSPVVPSYTRLVSAPQSHLQCFYFFFWFIRITKLLFEQMWVSKSQQCRTFIKKKYRDEVLLLKKE